MASPTIEMPASSRAEELQRTLRRKVVLDRLIAMILLVPGLPLMWFLQVLIRLTSKGPSIYKQARVGQDGRLFTMYKLRSMRVDAESKTGPVWTPVGARDPRMTWLGAVLRKTHLDELPQLYNVFKGEMSLVGPRPERPEFVEVLAEEIPGYLDRLQVPPGITGLAQINLPPDTDLNSVRRKLAMDMDYVDNASISLDLRILLCTVLRLFFLPGLLAARWLGVQRPAPSLPGELATGQLAGAVLSAIDAQVLSPRAVADLRVDPAHVASLSFGTVSASQSADALSVAEHSVKSAVLNAFTVDVEDYFHVTAFEGIVSRAKWSSMIARVVDNTHRIMELLDKHQVRGTFYVLGWVAEHYPQLVREIAASGHEIGSHSYWHRLVYQQTPEEFRGDLQRSRDVLQDLTGSAVTSYRAPTFSITQKSLWALDILAEEGFTVDSSIMPARHDRYGIPDAPVEIHRVKTSSGLIWEFPPTVMPLGFTNLPVGGGGYFRLYPYGFTSWSLNRVNVSRPFMFYTHPWEVDPDQPRMEAPTQMGKMRHYVNLHRTADRIDQLLSRFSFGPVSAVIAKNAETAPVIKTQDLIATAT